MSDPVTTPPAVPTRMRAAQFGAYGPPEVIRSGTVPVPQPGPGEIQVRVGATTVNGTELALRSGRYRLLSGRRFPKGVGVEFAGTVTRVGPGVTEFRDGDRVWGVLDYLKTALAGSPIGAAAEYLTVAADRVAPLPHRVSFVDAAALLAGSTALAALRDVANLHPGEKLLVRGGTGSVGHAAVQLGHALGAHVTTLVSEPNLDIARRLGAIAAFDYRTVQTETLGQFDVIFDTAGTRMNTFRKLLRPHGRMITITFKPILAGILTTAISARHGERRIRWFSGKPTRELLQDYVTFIEDDQVRALIAETHDLDHLADAHRAAEASGAPGKQIIIP